MNGVVNEGGYDKSSIKRSLATPRASKDLNVYGLSVDVFCFDEKPPLASIGVCSISLCL